jgi:hypothetical protein
MWYGVRVWYGQVWYGYGMVWSMALWRLRRLNLVGRKCLYLSSEGTLWQSINVRCVLYDSDVFTHEEHAGTINLTLLISCIALKSASTFASCLNAVGDVIIDE